ncbi:hypothetical protein AWN76_014115 [Rhodothermaceae bacterium RA]|nr:hypothetical protein AWN76_014115 [Rhodothermaceae bacterium RA]
MNAERWEHIETLFERALDLEPAAREAFLDEACGDDAALRGEVASLLASYTAAQPFFARLADQVEPIVSARLEPPGAPPARIGPYRIDRELGRGGMGTVYHAERDDGQYRQQVAIKLLRREFASDDVVRRFLAERQILASLNHPNIARLLDGGMTETGRPYFVLEYVEGWPILDYCETHRLGLEARLRLFQDVCAAVQYAHQNLIVHRDLKPGNILVADGAETGAPQVKLLDFGIAKLMQPGMDGHLAMTHTDVRPMTPLYASPEQLRGERVTTASDVYQLGVLLYELLTGQRPYARFEPTAYQIERAICEEDPPPPSQAVPPGGARPPWSRRLRGDLDAIVGKAMRKVPDERYESAAALSGDVERYLEQRPVRARRGNVTYRFAKFVRKHRVAVAAAGVIAVLLVTLAVLSVRFALVTARQADLVARERDKAAQMASFLVELFQVSDPNERQGTDVTAEELLLRGASRIETELRDQPETRAMLMNVIGRIYRQLGMYRQSETLLSLALDERRQALGDWHPDVAETQQELGRLRRAQGAYATAESLLTEALAMQRALFGERHVRVAQTLSDLGWVLHNKGEAGRAAALFNEALTMRRELLGPRHEDVAESLSSLAAVRRHQGAYDEAEQYYRQALAMYREVLGPEHLQVARALNDLAAMLQDLGRYDEAETYARASLDLYSKLFGTEHPDVATSLSNLAYVQQNKGDYEAAEQGYREALAMRRRLLGDDHPHVAHSLNNLAAVLQDQGRFEEAEPYAREALALYRKVFGDTHRLVAQALTNLGWMLRNRGALDEARPLFKEVVQIRTALYGGQHPQVAQGRIYLGSLLHRLGRWPAAEAEFQQALSVLADSMYARHPLRAMALSSFGELRTDQGRPEAMEMLQEALEIREAVLPPGHWQTAETRSALGACLMQQGRYEEAEPLLRQAVQILSERRGARHPVTQRALARLAQWDAARPDPGTPSPR